MSPEVVSIVLVGVGGQGTLLATQITARAALLAGRGGDGRGRGRGGAPGPSRGRVAARFAPATPRPSTVRAKALSDWGL